MECRYTRAFGYLGRASIGRSGGGIVLFGFLEHIVKIWVLVGIVLFDILEHIGRHVRIRDVLAVKL